MAVVYNKALKCKDCKYSKAHILARLMNISWAFQCTHPKSWNEPDYNPVTGKTGKGFYSSCGGMRVKKDCGPEAKSWVPRNSKLIFLALREG